MSTLASFVSGRRGKWIVARDLGRRLRGSDAAGLEARRPDPRRHHLVPARERRVDRGRQERSTTTSPSGETTQGLIVYQRDGGLTAADQQRIAAQAKEIEGLPASELPLTRPPAVPFAPGSPPDRSSRPTATSPTRSSPCRPTTRRRPTGARTSATPTGDEADGMRILLTGDLGFSADSEEVFGELDTKLLAATVLLVLVLLGAIYRSVLVALTPLVVVFFAYTVATAFVYLYAKSGATVSSNGTTILDRADVRGRHRLLPAAGLALPRGAAPDRGQARRDGARRAPDRADDPRQRADRLARDADPDPGRRPPDLDPRPGGRDRGRLRDGRRADPAARRC